MPTVAGSRHSFRGDTMPIGPRRSLYQLEQVPPNGLLNSRLAGDFHVGSFPERIEPFPLVLLQGRESHLHRAVNRARTAEGQFFSRHMAGGMVGHELFQPYRHSLFAIEVVNDAGVIVPHARIHFHARFFTSV